MSELIDRQALRAAHGLGSDCHDCKRDMKSCQYDRDYSLMDFCEWLDDAPTVSPWHRVEEPPKLDELIPNKFYASSMLVMFYHGGYYIGYALSDEKNGPVRWVSDGMTIPPTHWMTIEPPKEDE